MTKEEIITAIEVLIDMSAARYEYSTSAEEDAAIKQDISNGEMVVQYLKNNYQHD